MNMLTACFTAAKNSSAQAIAANLVSSWIPALSDVKEKLEAGARVADVGCGKGASTLLMAAAFPNSRFLRLRLPRQVDRGGARIRQASRRGTTASHSKYRRRRSFQVKTTTWWPSSIACMTWVTRSERPPMSGSPWPRTALDDRRTLRQRRIEGQSESRGASLLFSFHAVVHALLAVAGGRTVLRRPSGREAHSGGGDHGRVQPFPAGCGDAFQHRFRGSAIIRTTRCAGGGSCKKPPLAQNFIPWRRCRRLGAFCLASAGSKESNLYRINARRILFTSGWALLFACYAPAQEAINFASVGGRVTDPSGAAVAGALVVARQIATTSSVLTSTGQDGRFRFPYLTVGEYEIAVRHPGFQESTERITLTAGAAFELPFALELGQYESTVTVSAESPTWKAHARRLQARLPRPKCGTSAQRPEFPRPRPTRTRSFANQHSGESAIHRNLGGARTRDLGGQPAQFLEQLHCRWHELRTTMRRDSPAHFTRWMWFRNSRWSHPAAKRSWAEPWAATSI